MFFYNLPRFSTDLDFNLLNEEKETEVYERVRKIILKYGKIHDEAIKHYGIILVLDYGIKLRYQTDYTRITMKSGTFWASRCALW